MRIRRLMVAATLTLLAALAAASPASADPGNVFRDSDCVTFPDYGTVCYDIRQVANLTETPSGNVSAMEHFRTRQEFTGSGPLAGCNYSSNQAFDYHNLYKDGTLHELGSRAGTGAHIECQGNNYECTSTYYFHEANGRVQFTRGPEFECTRL
jgi:phage tail protein X